MRGEATTWPARRNARQRWASHRWQSALVCRPQSPRPQKRPAREHRRIARHHQQRRLCRCPETGALRHPCLVTPRLVPIAYRSVDRYRGVRSAVRHPPGIYTTAVQRAMGRQHADSDPCVSTLPTCRCANAWLCTLPPLCGSPGEPAYIHLVRNAKHWQCLWPQRVAGGSPTDEWIQLWIMTPGLALRTKHSTKEPFRAVFCARLEALWARERGKA
jgi:hypothetical protein